MILTEYEHRCGGITAPLTLALVSDLHDREPAELLTRLRALKPDAILCAGDIAERNVTGTIMMDGTPCPWTRELMLKWQGSRVKHPLVTAFFQTLDGSMPGLKHVPWNNDNGRRFLRQAAKIAPLYLSMGNHEWYFTPDDAALFRKTGATLLDNADCETVIAGQTLRIGGLSTRYDLKWLAEYAAKPGTKLLLMHHPELYRQFIRCMPEDCFDLILCGHVHGGQWRFFGHGVYAPGQGLFPPMHHGSYPTEGGELIVSSGVSNTSFIPRFGNPCELVSIRLVPEE